MQSPAHPGIVEWFFLAVYPGALDDALVEGGRRQAGCRFGLAGRDRVRDADMENRTFGELADGLDDCDPAAVRAAVLHLLWRGELKTDLSTPLSDRHQLMRSA